MRNQPTHYLRQFQLPLLALGLSILASPAVAEPYPSKLSRIVVHTSAGTPPDTITRIIANELAQSEGLLSIVENKPGAGGTICQRSRASARWPS